MSMSTNIYGVIPADTHYKKMAAIWHQCEDAKVTIPKEVVNFFHGEPPDDDGILIDLEQLPCCKVYSGEESAEGVEIDISRLPENVKKIRFYNSF